MTSPQPDGGRCDFQPQNPMIREITPDAWKMILPDVCELYLVRNQELAATRTYIRRKYHLDTSTKHWKRYLSTSGIKKYLCSKDAAHILRLYVDAERHGIRREVRLQNMFKSRDHVRSYIKRKKITSEEDLIAILGAGEELPSYITYRDIGRPQLRPMPDDVTQSSSPISEWVDPMATPTSHRESQGQSTIYSDMTEDQGTSSAGAVVYGQPSWDFIEDLPDPTYNVDQADFAIADDSNFVDANQKFAVMACKATNMEDFTAMTNSFLGGRATDMRIESSPIINGLMSASPVKINTFTSKNLFSNWDLVPGTTNAVGVDSSMNETLGTVYFSVNSSMFLITCSRACIQRGQNWDYDSDLVVASQWFEVVLRNEFEDCLTVLHTLVAMLETFGQKSMSVIVLGYVQDILNKNREIYQPIIDTVHFMIITQSNEKGNDSYDTNRLERTYKYLCQSYGTRSRLALTACFNLAWALAEVRQYEEAQPLLVLLKVGCENALGLYHPQTISTATLLARVHLGLGEYVSARQLTEDIFVVRVEKAFSNTHAFYWEIKNRQALFLKRLSRTTQIRDQGQQQDYLQQAETILHQVLHWRFAILGCANPRTIQTYKELRRLLNQRNKTAAANDLWRYCEQNYQQWLTTSCESEAFPHML